MENIFQNPVNKIVRFILAPSELEILFFLKKDCNGERDRNFKKNMMLLLLKIKILKL